MNRTISLALLTLAMLTGAQPAGAEHEPHYPFYFGFSVGFPSADASCDYYGYNCNNGNTGLRISGGKQLHRNLALEIAFHDLGRLRNERSALTTTAEPVGVNLSVLGIIPFSDSMFLYGKAGYMATDVRYRRFEGGVTSSTDKTENDFTYGFGFGFRFNEIYDFRVEYERLTDLGDEFVPGGDHVTSFSLGGTIYLE